MDSIRVVLADDHPIVRAGMHLLETARHLFEDVAPDILVIEMALAGTSDHPSDTPTEGGASPQVLVLRGDHDREYIFGLRIGGLPAALTEHEALHMIAEVIQARLDREGHASCRQIVATMPHQQIQGAHGATPSLTARELDLVRLLPTGQTDRELGAQLGISKSTVRYHLQNIYKKLGLQQRSAVIAWAVRAGLGEEAG